MFQKTISICLPLITMISLAHALPTNQNVVEGQATFEKTNNYLKITTSDKTIINYTSFNIDSQERVEFVQPNSQSCALNRVCGGTASNILGNLTSNGKLFLVNPYGIYFGPQANVNTGSLVASTLDIADDDFINEKYVFKLNKTLPTGSILNEGFLSASDKGVIALLAPSITQNGLISAETGQILAGAAEQITLDFSGDGTMSFALEGELNQAVIEQLGDINSKGDIYLQTHTANQAIKMVVNTEGISKANQIVKSGGTIRLSSKQKIAGQQIDIKSDYVEMAGQTIAQGNLTVEGKNHLKIRDSQDSPLVAHTYGHMVLQSDCVDILALSNPKTSIASTGDMTLISDHDISMDAHFWSGRNFSLKTCTGLAPNAVSFYDPIIWSSGSVEFGNYSGVSLKVVAQNGIRFTGNTINITGPDVTAVGDPDSAILTTTAALILRAGTTPAAGLPPGNQVTNVQSPTAGGATFSLGVGGNITFDFPTTITATSTASIAGTVIMSVPNPGFGTQINSFGDLTINAGTVNNTSNSIQIEASTSTNGQMTLNAPNGTIQATNYEDLTPISLNPQSGAILSAREINLRNLQTTTGSVAITANNLSLGLGGFPGNISSGSGGSLTINPFSGLSTAVTINELSTITSGTTLSINGTINPTNPFVDLTLSSSGNMDIFGAIGSNTPFSSLSLNASSNILDLHSQPISVTGQVQIIAGTAFLASLSTTNAISADIQMNISNLLRINSITTNNNNVTILAQNIESYSPTDALTIDAGTGIVNIQSAIGTQGTLNILDITAGTTQYGSYPSFTLGQISVTSSPGGYVAFNSNLELLTDAEVVSNGNNIIFDGLINSTSATSFVLTANAGIGNIQFLDVVGGVDPLGGLTASGNGIQISGNISTNGFQAIALNGGIQILNSLSLLSDNSDVYIEGTLDAAVTGLNLDILTNAGGHVHFNAIVGQTLPFDRLYVQSDVIDTTSVVVADEIVVYQE